MWGGDGELIKADFCGKEWLAWKHVESDMLNGMQGSGAYHFGVLRERLGGGSGLKSQIKAIVADVLNVYRERLRGFSWDSIAVAVNQEYARAEQRVEGWR